VVYYCINRFPFPLIYGLVRMIIVEVIMLFWQVCKVAIFKNLSWFLICLGWNFSLPSTLPSISHTTHHCGIKECPNQLCRNVGPSWLAFLGSHKMDLHSFPFQHTWIWNSLFKLFGVTFIFFLCLSSLTLIYDIKQTFQDLTQLVPFFFSNQKINIKN